VPFILVKAIVNFILKTLLELHIYPVFVEAKIATWIREQRLDANGCPRKLKIKRTGTAIDWPGGFGKLCGSLGLGRQFFWEKAK